MKQLHISLLAFAFLLPASAVSADEYDVRGGLSNVSFISDATLETITGTSSDISGTLTVDLSNPGATTGSITVPVTSLRTGVDMRDEHLHGADWLNAGEHPDITFAITAVDVSDQDSLRHGQTLRASVTGEFSLNGATQTLSAPAEVSFYEIASEDISGSYGVDGDIVRVETNFDVELADFGVSIAPPLRLKVAPTINVSVRLSAIRS